MPRTAGVAPRGNHLNRKLHSRNGHKKAQERTKTPTDKTRTYGIRLFVFLVAMYCLLRTWADLVNQPQTEAQAGSDPPQRDLLCAGLPTRPQFDRRSPVFESECASQSAVSWRPTVGAAVRSGDRTTTSQPHGNEDWVKEPAKQLGLESTLRSRGRGQKDRALKPEHVAIDLDVSDVSRLSASGVQLEGKEISVSMLYRLSVHQSRVVLPRIGDVVLL